MTFLTLYCKIQAHKNVNNDNNDNNNNNNNNNNNRDKAHITSKRALKARNINVNIQTW